MITTEIADFNLLQDQEIRRLYDIMHHAYKVTEIEIWGEDYARMSESEFQEIIEKRELIIARIEDKIVGSISTAHLYDETWGFGLLSADFSKKGLGIGRTLIQAVENLAIENNAQYMEIEILKPKEFDLKSKLILHDWYEKMGYHFQKSVSFEERKPSKKEKAKRLIVPCVFDCYRKTF